MKAAGRVVGTEGRGKEEKKKKKETHQLWLSGAVEKEKVR